MFDHARSDFGPGAVSYRHPNVQRVLWATEKVRVIALQPMPSMEELLMQPVGMFLIEFRWRNEAMDGDWHVLAVNCDRRCVLDNTLGIIPFTGTLLLSTQCRTVA